MVDLLPALLTEYRNSTFDIDIYVDTRLRQTRKYNQAPNDIEIRPRSKDGISIPGPVLSHRWAWQGSEYLHQALSSACLSFAVCQCPSAQSDDFQVLRGERMKGRAAYLHVTRVPVYLVGSGARRPFRLSITSPSCFESEFRWYAWAGMRLCVATLFIPITRRI
jgi:hypothetical protein